MKRFAFIFSIILLTGAAFAHAGDVYVTARVNLRAGPDGGYPVVRVLKPDQRVELQGCLQNGQWCEVVAYNGIHGWVYSPYLRRSGGQKITIIESGPYGSRILIFRPNDYWNKYYRKESFYTDRYRWIPRDDHHHHHDKDDDDDHGYHPDRPPVVEKPEPAAPKYQKMKTPGDGNYNPLCRMGQKDC